ncbi:RicAFT regulatory complex protein RicA family protein [Marinicrinis lubricantis]|uniref:RicAFT regulatory complex protein RicA family protein n=1 Tax=Marinicrinis lubricantis TaxID=2086470 RepID=A0ABW1IM78_9BACL
MTGHAHAHEHGKGDLGTMKSYNVVDLVVREDIMKKTKELAELISTSDEVIMYQKAEKQIQANDKIQTLIAQIKKKQKEIVGFEYFQNEKMVKKIEAEMQALQDELDGIPLVQQFQQTQTDINDLLQFVVQILKDSLSEKIQIEGVSQVNPENCSD